MPKDEEKREIILKAALERFKRFGFRKTTVDEIAKDARTSKRTIYKYFTSKEEIFKTAYREMMYKETARVKEIMDKQPSVTDKLKLGFTIRREIIPQFSKEFLEDVSLPEIWEGAREFRQKQFGMVVEIIEEGIAKGELKPINPQLVTMMIIGIADILLTPEFILNSGIPFEEIIEAIEELLFYGICRRDERRNE